MEPPWVYASNMAKQRSWAVGALAFGVGVFLLARQSSSDNAPAAMWLGGVIVLGALAFLLLDPSWSLEVDEAFGRLRILSGTRLRARVRDIPLSDIAELEVRRITQRGDGTRIHQYALQARLHDLGEEIMLTGYVLSHDEVSLVRLRLLHGVTRAQAARRNTTS